MSLLVLRGEIPSLKIKKTVKAEPDEKVADFVNNLLKKAQASNTGGFLVYKLRQPDVYHDPILVDPNLSLSRNGFQTNDVVLIKKEPKEIFVFFPEIDKKQRFMVDYNDTVDEFVKELVILFEIKKPEDYFLSKEGEEGPLDPQRTLLEVQIPLRGTVVLRNRKVTVTAVAKNVTNFIQKSVEKGIQQGAGKLKQLKEQQSSGSLGISSGKKFEAASQQVAGGQLFGIPLEEGAKVGKHDYEIPLIIESCLQFVEKLHLKTEGIFRLSGATSIVNQLRELYDRGEDPDLSQISDPHAVTGVMKAYLRELPEPPLTYSLFPVFNAVLSAPVDSEARSRYYRIVVKTLPRANYVLIRRLFGFLSNLTKYAEFTKMHSRNLSTVFGPNLLKQKNETALETVENTMTATQLTDDMIRHYADIFEFKGKDPKYTHFAKTLYPYAGKSPNELTFEANQVIFVTNGTSSDGWWEGEFGGKLGLCPGNYLEVILDHSRIELNDDTSRVAARIKDEIQRLQKEIKEDIQKRKDLETSIQALFEKFQELTLRANELERRAKLK